MGDTESRRRARSVADVRRCLRISVSETQVQVQVRREKRHTVLRHRKLFVEEQSWRLVFVGSPGQNERCLVDNKVRG